MTDTPIPGMADAATREPGFYWVRWNYAPEAAWETAEYRLADERSYPAPHWRMHAMGGLIVGDHHFAEISPRITPPRGVADAPVEPPSRALPSDKVIAMSSDGFIDAITRDFSDGEWADILGYALKLCKGDGTGWADPAHREAICRTIWAAKGNAGQARTAAIAECKVAAAEVEGEWEKPSARMAARQVRQRIEKLALARPTGQS